jgi:hypothetical protein
MQGDEGSKCVSGGHYGQADIAHHVIGCRLTQVTSAQHALDDLEGNMTKQVKL